MMPTYRPWGHSPIQIALCLGQGDTALGKGAHMYCDQNTRLFCKQRQNFPMDHEKKKVVGHKDLYWTVRIKKNYEKNL